MGKGKELWWPYIRNVIRMYPIYQEKLKDLKSTKITPTYSKGGGVGKSCRKTELVALRTLEPKEQAYFDAVDRALKRTQRMPDGDLRIKLIRLAYMQKRQNLKIYEAADKCFVSYSTALRWNKDFVYMVASYLKEANMLT